MQIIYDVFPAHFVIAAPSVYTDVQSMSSSPPSQDAYYLQTTRVIVTDTNIVVAQDSPQGPQIMFNEPYDSFVKSGRQNLDSYAVTTSGKTIAFKKDTNCGCGSSLRGWNPYRTISSMKDPSA